MKLLTAVPSPYGRKVKIVAAMKGLSPQVEIVLVDSTKGDPALAAANPLGKIPCLITDKGEVIYDSHVICEYLDGRVAHPVLFPGEGAERWRMLTLAALGDGMLDAALLLVYEKRFRPEEKWHQPWLDRQQGKIDAALAQLEAAPPVWSHHPNYAHITLACALGYLDFRHEGRWRSGRPALVAWLDRFAAAVPSFETTKPAA